MKRAALHTTILCFASLTLLPFVFMINNSFRSNSELYHSFFGLPRAVTALVDVAADGGGADGTYRVADDFGNERQVTREEALEHHARDAGRGYRQAWTVIRPYMINSLFVCGVTAFGVMLLGSLTGYVLARYRFPGSQAVFLVIIGAMMFPGVLTLIPLFLVVRELNLLNTYWAMILPYMASGQVFAVFIFKSFFEGLPEELFESARIDGAGHAQLYGRIVVPLSKPIFAMVAIMNVIGTWNNYLWPLITNTEGEYHVVASGLFVLAASPYAASQATLYAAYVVSSIPLLVLFVYATRPFIQGLTSGALKA